MTTLIFIGLFAAASWWGIVNQKYRNFKRYLKEDDPIRFYIGEEKHTGTVKLIGRKYIHINHMGTVKKILPENTYPVFRYNYNND